MNCSEKALVLISCPLSLSPILLCLWRGCCGGGIQLGILWDVLFKIWSEPIKAVMLSVSFPCFNTITLFKRYWLWRHSDPYCLQRITAGQFLSCLMLYCHLPAIDIILNTISANSHIMKEHLTLISILCFSEAYINNTNECNLEENQINYFYQMYVFDLIKRRFPNSCKTRF